MFHVFTSFVRKLSILVFTGSLFLSNFLTTLAFTDVDDSHSYQEAILQFQKEGKIQGYEDGTFKPDTTIARSEFLKILFTANPALEVEDITDCFPDVNTQWFAQYVCTAKEKGIVNGAGDGLFHPNDEIIFAEAAKIILKTSDATLLPAGNEGRPWYADYIVGLGSRRLVPMGITDANQKITRAEMVEMMWRKENFVPGRKSTVFSFRDDGTYFTMIDVGGSYLWKDNIMWHGHTQIPEADFDSFVGAGFDYAYDKNFVYFKGKKIEGAIPPLNISSDLISGASFYLINNGAVFYQGTKIANADPESFVVIRDPYSQDADAVYYRNEKTDIDPETIQKTVAIPFITMGSDSRGNNYIYFAGEISPLDPHSFKYLGYRHLRDKNAIYYWVYDTELRKVVLKKIENADLDTFYLFHDSGYATDKNFVYYFGEIIQGADPGGPSKLPVQ